MYLMSILELGWDIVKCERWCFVLLLLSINVSPIGYVSVVRVIACFDHFHILRHSDKGGFEHYWYIGDTALELYDIE